mgnify:CR=1 FL=1
MSRHIRNAAAGLALVALAAIGLAALAVDFRTRIAVALAAAVLLAGAFLIKSAMWPLCFWLPNAYSAASPPVAAGFSIMTKVGVYTVIRLGLLLFGGTAGASAGFGAEVLVAGGLATIAFGMVGVLAGLWSEKFDHLAAVQNFIVMPMTFLSGTFYLVDNLPEPFRSISHFNPFFYLIDGFRYGFIGHAESNLAVGVIGSAALMAGLGAICWLVFRSGWRLKS